MAHRSIEERLEALQLQHARLLAVQAKKKLRNHPVMESLQSRLTEISNNNLKYARWETEWQEKVENFKQRVAEWIERGNVAQEPFFLNFLTVAGSGGRNSFAKRNLQRILESPHFPPIWLAFALRRAITSKGC